MDTEKPYYKKYKNKGRCKLCQSVIESKHTHHFVSCKCGEVCLDGGNDYWRVIYKTSLENLERIEEPLEES